MTNQLYVYHVFIKPGSTRVTK